MEGEDHDRKFVIIRSYMHYNQHRDSAKLRHETLHQHYRGDIMDRGAKVELAKAILDTLKAREKTWNKEKERYAMDYFTAAQQAVRDPELRPIVAAMCTAGYVDFPEWAEKIMKGPAHHQKRGR